MVGRLGAEIPHVNTVNKAGFDRGNKGSLWISQLVTSARMRIINVFFQTTRYSYTILNQNWIYNFKDIHMRR